MASFAQVKAVLFKVQSATKSQNDSVLSLRLRCEAPSGLSAGVRSGDKRPWALPSCDAPLRRSRKRDELSSRKNNYECSVDQELVDTAV